MRVIKLHGPSGSGPTMLARRLPLLYGGPLRAPHHTISRDGLIQEAGLAMGGVLYLDDVDEFKASDLRALIAHLLQAHKLGCNVPTVVFHTNEDRHAEVLALAGLAITIDCTFLSSTHAIGHFCTRPDSDATENATVHMREGQVRRIYVDAEGIAWWRGDILTWQQFWVDPRDKVVMDDRVRRRKD
jgi:hypothetical protein